MRQRFYRALMIGAAGIAAALAAFGAAALAADSGTKLYLGDVNVDSYVNVADAVHLARYVAEDMDASLTRQGSLNADVNQDKDVDSSDSNMLLEILAGIIPHPQDVPPAETTDEPETTTTAETATTEQTTTTAETTTEQITTGETTTVSEETQPPQTVPPAALTVGTRTLPLGDPAEEVIALPEIAAEYGSLTEKLSLAYNTCMMDFYVYAEDTANTMILFSRDGIVIGYYTTAKEYACSNLYTITEYRDTHPDGTGELYAVMALSSSASIYVDSVRDQNDLHVFSRLNFFATNAIRGVYGLPALHWNEQLAEMAQAHSDDMAENNYMSHTDSAGMDPGDRIRASGIKWRMIGENVDGGLRDPFAAADDWFRSVKGHREEMLGDKYTDIGIGFAYRTGTKYGIYGTQDYLF
ncbi:MAG: hypothetical protein II723_00405 [Oscillospiraceae bacterium]|nr:hypothetical protein [Oscillospiraceae bacterium]